MSYRVHLLRWGRKAYRNAWEEQETAASDVRAGGDDLLALVEHPPVYTFGRRVRPEHLLVAAEELSKRGAEVVESDRGGDITFHGPGQLVAYPIVRLNDHALSVGRYVRTLEDAVIATLAEFGVQAFKDPTAIGVWTNLPVQKTAAKICALGVRIKRGISLHGIALNLTTDLSYFNLINPCGLSRPVTSLHQIMGQRAPTMQSLKETLAAQMKAAFT